MDEVPDAAAIDKIKDPRQRLMMAGARQLADHGFDLLAGGLNPEAITATAGRSRRVFYDHFEDKAQFLSQMLRQYFDATLHHFVADASPEDVSSLLRLTDGDLFEAVERIVRLSIEARLGSEGDLMQVFGVAVAGGDPDLADQVDRFYRDLDTTTVHVLTILLESWGLRFRPPWTPDAFAQCTQALADGLSIRARMHPDIDALELFTLAALTLVPVATAPQTEVGGTVYENMSRFAADLAATWREFDQQPADVDYFDRLVEAFRSELRSNGFGALTINQVAKSARISPALIERNYPTITTLLRTVVRDSLPSLQSEAEFDLASQTITAREALRRHLIRLGSWATANPDLSMAIMASASSNPNDADRTALTLEFIREFSAPAVSILVAGVDRGELREDASIVELASMTSEIMLGRSGAMPDFSIEPTVAFIDEIVFEGAGRL